MPVNTRENGRRECSTGGFYHPPEVLEGQNHAVVVCRCGTPLWPASLLPSWIRLSCPESSSSPSFALASVFSRRAPEETGAVLRARPCTKKPCCPDRRKKGLLPGRNKSVPGIGEERRQVEPGRPLKREAVQKR